MKHQGQAKSETMVRGIDFDISASIDLLKLQKPTSALPVRAYAPLLDESSIGDFYHMEAGTTNTDLNYVGSKSIQIRTWAALRDGSEHTAMLRSNNASFTIYGAASV
jgi:hypothetical protein